jgi:tRNA (mo5U34)-methyltransferase
LSRWQAALDALPDVTPTDIDFGNRVTATGTLSATQEGQLIDALMGLQPWRKGPFELFGVHLDTEWRSDWKWQRIAAALGSLEGQTVLDVGCGNGYFGWRALAAGAREVVGIDPSVLFYLQHQALSFYLNREGRWSNHLLPAAFEALPEVCFDLVLSMGVVYHRPDPAEHITRLFRCTRPGGRVLLESLVVESGTDLFPSARKGAGNRYARMRNVSIIPTLETMSSWLEDAGFNEVCTVDVSVTKPEEQRSTPWMSFESFSNSLDP